MFTQSDQSPSKHSQSWLKSIPLHVYYYYQYVVTRVLPTYTRHLPADAAVHTRGARTQTALHVAVLTQITLEAVTRVSSPVHAVFAPTLIVAVLVVAVVNCNMHNIMKYTGCFIQTLCFFTYGIYITHTCTILNW